MAGCLLRFKVKGCRAVAGGAAELRVKSAEHRMERCHTGCVVLRRLLH